MEREIKMGKGAMKAVQLKTEFLKNPCGIDVVRPYLSWFCEGGKRQTAYEIRAVLCGGDKAALPAIGEGSALIWSSGRVESGQMNAVFGVNAESRQHILWQVRLWDEQGQAGEWSEAAEFEMGLLEKKDFAAKWINPELKCDPEAHKPASYLRTRFQAHPGGKPARLYITCHGLYEAYINGSRVGGFVLAPGTYTYDKRLAYQTYDVTELLAEGANEALVLLGDGWYRSCSGVDGDRNLYGEDVSLFFQLEIDGRPVCVSDEGWEASQEGPLRENDMQQGEVYDAAREEITGWHEVKVEAFSLDNLVCSNCMPIVEKERFTGRLVTTPNGETVIDYGQNLAGYIEFSLEAHAGDTIVLTHGEALDENGNFTTENFQDRKRHKEGGIKQQVIYTCKEGRNQYKSRFTIWGFRYAKVETNVDLSRAEFTSIAVYSDMEQTAWFECSHKAVDQLVRNSLWSMKSNFCDVPTDCPTRERAAWTGDMGVFAGTGLYLLDCYPVIRKWLAECRLNQYEDGRIANIAPKNNNPGFFSRLLAGSVGWGDACVIVPYELYKRCGNVRILEENYEMMKGWYCYLESRAGKKEGETEGEKEGKKEGEKEEKKEEKKEGETAEHKRPVGAPDKGAQTGEPVKGAQTGEPVKGAQTEVPDKGAQTEVPDKGEQTGAPDLNSLPAEYQEKAKQALAAGMSLQEMAAMTGSLLRKTGIAGPKENPYADFTIETGIDYGEWCEPDVVSTEIMGKPQTSVATAYFAHTGQLLSEIAELLGHEEDAVHFRKTAENAAKAFRFIATEEGKIHSDRQAEYVRAISFGLLEEQETQQAADELNRLIVENDYHLNTGFLSTPSLCGVLTDHGYLETAYRLLLQDTMPGWLYEVKKGATTVWENWDGINEKGEIKASLNHYSYGAVCGWLFEDVCGIHVEKGNVTIAPRPFPLLEHARAVYRSGLGELVSAWRYEEDGITCTVTVPPNVKARIILPDGSIKEAEAGTFTWPGIRLSGE